MTNKKAYKKAQEYLALDLPPAEILLFRLIDGMGYLQIAALCDIEAEQAKLLEAWSKKS